MPTQAPPRAETSAEGYDLGEETEDDLRATPADIRRERNRAKVEGRAQAREAREEYRASEPAPPRANARSTSRPRSYYTRARAVAQPPAASAAEFMVGVLVYAVAVNYMRGGSTQVRQWFAAKFYNQTTPVASSTAGVAPAAQTVAETVGTAAESGIFT